MRNLLLLGGRVGGGVWGGVRMGGGKGRLNFSTILRASFTASAKQCRVRWVWSGTGSGVGKWAWLRGVLVPGGVVTYRLLVGGAVSVAECRGGGDRRRNKHLPLRLIKYQMSHDQDLRFDWLKFWEFLLPELLLFTLALAVSPVNT